MVEWSQASIGFKLPDGMSAKLRMHCLRRKQELFCAAEALCRIDMQRPGDQLLNHVGKSFNGHRAEVYARQSTRTRLASNQHVYDDAAECV